MLWVVDTFKISEHFTQSESALKLQVIYTNLNMHKEFHLGNLKGWHYLRDLDMGNQLTLK